MKSSMKTSVLPLLFIALSCGRITSAVGEVPTNFQRENLVAWCIAHNWDSVDRDPGQRAGLLEQLGIGRYAYNWRSEDSPQFEQEILHCNRRGIEFFALWNEHPEAFASFEKHGIRPQIWKINPSPRGDSHEVRVAAAVNRLLQVVKDAKKFDFQFGLYNHGGWGGEPENLVAVCEAFHQRGFDNVGIVYNFHHGHAHIGRFADSLARMKPYLLCINLNGMADPDSVDEKSKKNKILPIGSGNHEAFMIKTIIDSGYTGPIGVLGHVPNRDVAITLRENLDGLGELLDRLDHGLRPDPK
tara:strand:+ start:13203 stop:14099 length:897 start_codon:yes stop_codon:yes gene_type:complete